MAIVQVNSVTAKDNGLLAPIVATLATTKNNEMCLAVSFGTVIGAGQATQKVLSVTDSVGTYYSKVGSDQTGITGVSTELWRGQALGTDSNNQIRVTYSVFSGVVVIVSQYSTVMSIGASGTETGTSATPALSVGMEDSGNFLVAAIAQRAFPANTFAAVDGTIRGQAATAHALANVLGGLVDNTSAATGSLTASVVSTSTLEWAMVAYELRTVVPSRNTVHFGQRLKKNL